MKATSVDQIREHLAKGGKVLARNDDRNEEWEAIEFNGGYLTVDVNGMRLSCPVERVKPEGWELVPLEEEKTAQGDSGVFKFSCPTPIRFHEYKRRLVIQVNGKDAGAGERIRQSLLFGHHPAIDDLLLLWEVLTGEKIELGRRCDACNASGLAQEGRLCACPDCNGSGYEVQPTWMTER